VVDVVAGGGKNRHRFWTLLSHEDSMRQHGVSATAFLTGTPAAVAAQELQRGALTKRGVMSGGGLEIRSLLKALLRHHVPLFEGNPSDPNGKPLSV
jgi:saccharopine dehydrogenase-like NADP-dependent oxidoreductase